MNVALIFAGGTGVRMRRSAKPKQFLELYGKPIIIYTLEIFERHPEIDSIVVPCLSEWQEYLERMVKKFDITKVEKILPGGGNTQESKMNALEYLNGRCSPEDIILLHDAVRPLLEDKIISENIRAVKTYGSAVTALPFTETAITCADGATLSTAIPRNTMYAAKAPQSFYFKDVYEAHSKGRDMPYSITIDTCTLMAELGKPIHLVEGESTNIKITTPEDYFIFKALVDMRASADIWGL